MQNPAWKHIDIFPIIAEIIREQYRQLQQYQQSQHYITCHEIASRLSELSEVKSIIDGPPEKIYKIAINMVSWFSQRITVDNPLPCQGGFERTKIDRRWAYKPLEMKLTFETNYSTPEEFPQLL